MEIRHTVRRLWKNPGVFVPATLTIAVGVAPMLLFTLAGQAMVPPVPLAEPETVVVLSRSNPAGDRFPMSYPKYEFLREGSRALDVFAYGISSMTLARGGEDLKVKVEPVTPNAFGALRVRPLVGRTFREDENVVPLGHPVAILGERFWRSRFAARPDVVGQTLTLNGVAFSIVGVVPASFPGLGTALHNRFHTRPMDVWVPAVMAPLGFHPDARRPTFIRGGSPHAQWLMCAARIRPGFTQTDVESELALLTARMHAKWPADDTEGVADDSILSWPAQDYALDPRLLAGLARLRLAGALVLLLACLNVGQLLLARSIDRQGDLALRLALGAPPRRFAIEPFVESALVTAGGVAAAAGLTWLIVRAVTSHPAAATHAVLGAALEAPISLPSLLPTALALFTFAVAACGAVPAWVRGGTNVSALLKRQQTSGRQSGFSSLSVWKPRGLVAAAQVALAVALLVPSGLLVRSLHNVLSRDPGFDAQGALTAEFALPSPHDSPAAALAFMNDVGTRLRGSGLVAAAGYTNCLPLSEGCLATGIKTLAASRDVSATVHTISPGLVGALGLRLVRGRDFGPDDRAGQPAVALISETAARQLGGDPVGTRIAVGGFVADAEIVGVVGDTHYRDLAAPIIAAVYLPFGQRPDPHGFVVVRGTEASLSASWLRETIASTGALREVSVRTMQDRVAASVARFRVATLLLASSAAMALALAGIGVFGLLAWLVGRTRHEIGVRLALGAAPGDMVQLTLRAAAHICLAGAAAGVIAGTWSAAHMRELLFRVAPWDVMTLGVTAIVATLLGVAAALLPARRAAQTDPVVALRQD